jgi:multidrug transporter EmrE-like cation transporter
MQLNDLALLLAAVASNVCASLTLKWASLSREADGPSWSVFHLQQKEILVVTGALVFYALSFAAYMFALRKVPVSIAYPVITGLTTLILVLAARPLFGEQLSISNLIGMCLVLTGSFLLFRT